MGHNRTNFDAKPINFNVVLEELDEDGCISMGNKSEFIQFKEPLFALNTISPISSDIEPKLSSPKLSHDDGDCIPSGGHKVANAPQAKSTCHIDGINVFSELHSNNDPSNLTNGEDGMTTVMLRNIPNKYSQQMLLDVINARGFQGLYDFFYLPIDFRNKCNVGYAFINLIHPHYAAMFKRAFHQFKLSAFKSQKVCEVSWGRVQGVSANVDHYRNSAIMSVAFPEYKPKIFSQGIEVDFPTSDGPLPSIKLRQGGGGGHNNNNGNMTVNGLNPQHQLTSANVGAGVAKSFLNQQQQQPQQNDY